MIIDRVYLGVESICVVIRSREQYHLAFELKDIPDVKTLIQKIKAKIIQMDSEPPPPPPADWKPFFRELKIALQGMDIGD